MTYSERESILSKEAISIDDFCKLYDVSRSTACEKILEIKSVVGDRLGIRGKLHIEDYNLYFNR